MRTLVGGLGRFALWLASAAFLVFASLFIIGSYLVTWPIMRKSPRQRHLAAAVNLGAAVMTMMAAMQNEEVSDSVTADDTGVQS